MAASTVTVLKRLPAATRRDDGFINSPVALRLVKEDHPAWRLVLRHARVGRKLRVVRLTITNRNLITGDEVQQR
jgi:hypothetical protein